MTMATDALAPDPKAFLGRGLAFPVRIDPATGALG